MRSAGLPLTIGYTGHPWDRALGQYFAPFRYYNPATARWNMRDPLGFVDGPNVYAYVAGNPVMYSDPSGGILGPLVCGLAIGGAIAGALYAADGGGGGATLGNFRQINEKWAEQNGIDLEEYKEHVLKEKKRSTKLAGKYNVHKDNRGRLALIPVNRKSPLPPIATGDTIDDLLGDAIGNCRK